ncbi:MAG TPA: RodZ domain-containing protein [Herbaspirillum sp.]|uniref:RodZ domain-containing protein n=2 Tax=Herbaspirillum sp. TaxID=1890675 RepID=UPI002D644868|nr:RodZ domain-containing protein [Herbaspirillum sp.]HZG22804.1 RodZ domain-containing protein [Herbaspirillum sp.]
MSDQQMNEMSSQQPQEAGQPSQTALMPGAMLAAARQKKGWSVEQVASLVKLAPRQIQAIEADNYAALPGLAVARGFVRSYAKVLGLDANVMTAAMPQESAMAQRDHIVPQHSLSTPFSEGPLPAMMMSTRGNSSALPVIAGVVVVALLAGAAAVRWTDLGAAVPQLAWLKSHKSEAAAPETAAQGAEVASADTPVNARVETIVPPAAEESSKEATKETAPVAATPAPPVAASPAPVEAATPAASQPASAVSQAATSAAPAAVPPGQMASTTVPSGLNIVNSKDLLRLTFREDSWVEIRRADKSTVISRLLKAGTTETFDVSDATTLIIGNAAGVDATLRGQALDLKTPGGSNVARLNLN